MELVNVKGEEVPHILYKPFIYSFVVDCSNHFTIFCPNKEIKVINKEKYGKEKDILMRDPKRISPFLHDIGIIWTNCAPDWRFGQLIENVFSGMDYVPFMLEEPRMIEQFIKYFKLEKNTEILKQLKVYKKVTNKKEVKK